MTPVLVLDGTIDPVALAENVGRGGLVAPFIGIKLIVPPSLAFTSPDIFILGVI